MALSLSLRGRGAPGNSLGEHTSGFTGRAFVIGALLSLLLGIGAPYANMIIRGTYMALDFSTAGALFLFFILVGVLNTLAKGINRDLALSGSEMVTIYIMMIIASAIPTCGWSEYLLPILTSPFYYATPENNWADLIHSHVPGWMVPQGSEVIKYFYEGLPEGRRIPWGAWIRPLLLWGGFAIALYLVMISVMVILRRQWVERERLIFPLVQVPLEMVRGERGSLLTPFFKDAVMWMGFSIPLAVGSLNALHSYFHFLPRVNLVSTLPIFRRTTTLILRVSFPMIGFSYFINLDIAFGLWLFNLLAKIQEGAFNVLGITSTEKLGIYSIPTSPILAHQKMGAMIVLVLFGLWVGRGHLKEVLRKALGRAPDVDDSGEILSYRAALLCLVGGLVFCGLWLWVSGLPPLVVLLFLSAGLVLFVGVTRIVAEAGVAAARAPMAAPDFVVSGIGCPALSPAGLTTLAFAYIWAADIRTFVMASCANGLKLGERIRSRSKRPLFWAMGVSIVVSLIGSVWIILKLSYTYGGINLNPWFFGGGALAPFNYVASKLNSPTPVHWGGWLSTGIGAGLMGLLMLARQHFLWWPLHPLGFPIGGIWVVDEISFSIFLAWLIKAVVLKYGGPRLYRRTRPFFLGLILGQYTTAGIWLVIDFFTGMTDNAIFFQL